MLTLNPNPAIAFSTKLQLINNWNGEVQIKVIDVVGKLTLTKSVSKTGDSMSVELPLNMPAGIYTVQATNGQEMVIERLIRL
jgi:hypothetical protein